MKRYNELNLSLFDSFPSGLAERWREVNCLHLFKEVSVLLVAFAQNKSISVQIMARNSTEEALTMLET